VGVLVDVTGKLVPWDKVAVGVDVLDFVNVGVLVLVIVLVGVDVIVVIAVDDLFVVFVRGRVLVIADVGERDDVTEGVLVRVTVLV
jgi:hypothetical protein